MSSGEKQPEITAIRRELRKLRAVCIFAGGAAHDYNNALTAVMGNISLARLEAEGNEELIDLLRDAEKASGRIKVMTEKMALYARGIRINKERSNIEEIVLAAISAASGGYAGSSSMKVDKDLPEIDVDPDLLLEALACIIENACEAAPSAGGEIEIGISREDVRSLASSPGDGLADGDYVRITVLDNGPGFNPEDSGRIFEPYYTTKKGSDGVGLALAYSILKRHRGFITASLPADGGALFSVYLPLF